MKKNILFTLFILLLSNAMKAQFALLRNQSPQLVQLNSQSSSANLLADSITQSVWENNAWKEELIVYLSYDANNRVTQEITKTIADGELSGRRTYQYDAQNRLRLVENEEYQQGFWVPHDKTEYQYNANGHRTSGIKYLHYGAQGYQMHEGDSLVYVYQGSNISSYTLYQISDGSVKPSQQLIWSNLNAESYPTQLEVRVFNGGIFEPYLKLENITWRLGYDPVNFIFSSYFGYQWNASAQSWTPQVYDTTAVFNGKRVANFLFSWNGSAIGQQAMRLYSIDAKGHEWKEEHFQWINNEWGQVYAELDSNVYGTQDELRINILGFRQRLNEPWNFVRKLVYHYQGTSSIQNAALQNTSRVYPNPGGKRFTLSVQNSEPYQVAVYDLKGKLIFEAEQASLIEVPTQGAYHVMVIYANRVERHLYLSNY